jgi:protein-tyrosine phosphatase
MRGLNKAILHGFFNIDTFNVEEYFHYEKVENGDMNWIVPGRFLAFSSPASRRITPDGMIHFTPDDYIPMFKNWNITAIVRLNKKMYDARSFTRHNFYHEDLFYPDGGLPPEDILRSFMALVDEWFLGPQVKGAIAVHCKAGLGRTGSLIGLYMMKFYRFTAAEAIAWLRICRPGSVIGVQQLYLKEMQIRMWKEGESIWKRNYSLISEPIPIGNSEYGETVTSPTKSSYSSSSARPTTQSSPTTRSINVSTSSPTTRATATSPSRSTNLYSTFDPSPESSLIRNRVVNTTSSPVSNVSVRDSLSYKQSSPSTPTRPASRPSTSSPTYSSSPYKYSVINRDSIGRTSYDTPPSSSGSLYSARTASSPTKTYGSTLLTRNVPSHLDTTHSRTPPVFSSSSRLLEQDSPTRKPLQTSLSTGKFESAHHNVTNKYSLSSHLSPSPTRSSGSNNITSSFADLSLSNRGAPMKRDHQLSTYNAERKRDNFLLRSTNNVVSKPVLNHYSNHNPTMATSNYYSSSSSSGQERSHSSGQW